LNKTKGTTTMTREERGIANAKEKEKAINAVTVMAALMAAWAVQVGLNGGYTTQPEHHEMWRSVSAICGGWGVVLLLASIFFRGSTLYVAASIIIIASGGYLATAPTLP
jgi:DhnA family fructose-bisphosphate aldolase class Ia